MEESDEENPMKKIKLVKKKKQSVAPVFVDDDDNFQLVADWEPLEDEPIVIEEDEDIS